MQSRKRFENPWICMGIVALLDKSILSVRFALSTPPSHRVNVFEKAFTYL